MPLLIIPAKRDSRRLPGKNMKMCAGKPLLLWTILAAKAADLGPVVVTSDCENILKYAHLQGCIAHLEQPGTLPEICIQVANKRRLGDGDPVIMLQPTSPLRTGGDIRAAYDLWCWYDQHANRSLASYVDIGKHQELLTTNGAIWIASRETLAQGTFRAEWHLPYMMPKNRSVDIDTAEDLAIAGALLRNQQGFDELSLTSPTKSG